jgi:two-component system, sensor histidine kinase
MLDSAEPGAEKSSSLLRQLAHEIRDALSPLASSADLARLRNFDPESSRSLADKVERGLRRALAILDAFVLSEQCEDGDLQLTLNRVPLEQIVQSARQALGEPARERYRFVSGGTGAVVRADLVRSAQALAAVLQHAAALGRRDCPVEVRSGETVAQPRIRVCGGIDPGNMPGDEWLDSWRGAEAGMPLRTARCVMRLQRGDLQLVTSDSGGWELVMSFAGDGAQADAPSHEPQPPQRPGPARPDPIGAAAGATILIVDDSREVRRAYREALQALGYRILEAADAEQALGALAGDTPDVALIDIHLPRMNGYRLAQAIRARAGAAIFLVMLSGMALDAVTRDLARQAGFDECLDKMSGPIALRELLATSKRNSLGNDKR